MMAKLETSVANDTEKEDLPLKALSFSREYCVTNALVTGWIISLGLIVIIRRMFRELTLIPSRRQALMECILDGLKDLLEPIVGKRALSYAFPVLLGYFFFILMHNWSGLFPGIGSIGWYKGESFIPILRPMNSDLNATLGIALMAMIIWSYCVLRCVGLQGFCEETFGNKSEKGGISPLIYQLLTLVFLAVGCIECISIAFRPISLSFRLFGNVFGGETLLHHMYGFGEFLTSGNFVQTDLYRMLSGISSQVAHGVSIFLSWIGYLLPLPFYFLECLIGLIQAFVFTLLVAVYIGVICHHDGETPVNAAAELQS
ncbi:MAG: F0F1 ATP synthase subunit A [Puniceicoccales bacterium]|nr:F0F1 ATP synthase subunit A [Puniceicoccales bacterium]